MTRGNHSDSPIARQTYYGEENTVEYCSIQVYISFHRGAHLMDCPWMGPGLGDGVMVSLSKYNNK